MVYRAGGPLCASFITVIILNLNLIYSRFRVSSFYCTLHTASCDYFIVMADSYVPYAIGIHVGLCRSNVVIT